MEPISTSIRRSTVLSRPLLLGFPEKTLKTRLILTWGRGLCSKTFYGRNWFVAVISYRVCHWQLLPPLSNLCSYRLTSLGGPKKPFLQTSLGMLKERSYRQTRIDVLKKHSYRQTRLGVLKKAFLQTAKSRHAQKAFLQTDKNRHAQRAFLQTDMSRHAQKSIPADRQV